MHTEIKLALNILYRCDPASKVRTIPIGVSKQPCFLCESFLKGINSPSADSPITFRLAPGHKKVYSGWEFSGIAIADHYVEECIWAAVDTLIKNTPHVESRDTVIATEYEGHGQMLSHEFADIEKNGWTNSKMKLDSLKWYTFLRSIS
jgi:hypothetical protein